MTPSNEETHLLAESLFTQRDVAGWCRLFDEVDSVYVDPIFGEFRGQAAIEQWLVEVMARAGSWRSASTVHQCFDGHVAAGESELVIPLAGEPFVLPFAWVQHYRSGRIVYRRDFYDTHELRSRVDSTALRAPGAPR